MANDEETEDTINDNPNPTTYPETMHKPHFRNADNHDLWRWENNSSGDAPEVNGHWAYQILEFVATSGELFELAEPWPDVAIRRTSAEWAYATVSVSTEREDLVILRRTRLKAASKCRFTANYMLRDGTWTPESQKLLTDATFKMQLEAPEWTLPLISECDGTRRGESMKAQGIIQRETPFQDFADVLAVMVSGGYLNISST